MHSQSGLRSFEFDPGGTEARPYLVVGRVTSSVPPGSPQYAAYVAQCLRSWTVDVRLENGDYIAAARVLSLQGNSREGVRRLPRLPRQTAAGETIPGDLVIVAFLNGSSSAPVVVGALSASAPPGTALEDIEAQQVATLDPDEWQDRQEYVDLSNPDETLTLQYVKRATGLMVEEEQAGLMRVNGTARFGRQLTRRRGGRDVESEQTVEVDDETEATVRHSNAAAADLRSLHMVKGAQGVSTVTVEDLQAQVLQLTQKVQELATLILRSDRGERLLLQQETPALRTTAFADSATKTVGLVHEDRAANTRAGWSIGPKGELLLRRLDAAGKETKLELNDDNSLTIQTPTGPLVHLDGDQVLVSSGGASVQISEDVGVSLTTKGGTTLVLADDAIVLTGDACTLKAGRVHLQTGALMVGDTLTGAQKVPSAERLDERMRQVERALSALATFCRSHVHPAPNGATGTSGTALSGEATPGDLFNLTTDVLKSVRAI